MRRMRFNPLYLILSFVLAIFLWFYVMGIQDPIISDTFYGVNVNLIGEDALYANNGFTVLNIESQTVNVRLSGKRSDILKVKPEDIYVEADLSKINSAGQNSVQCSVTPPDSSLTVENQSNVRILVNVDQLITKKIPVKLDYQTDIGEDAFVGTTAISPEFVTVTGSESELSGVAYAYVTTGDTPLTDSFYGDLPYTFVDASGNALSTQFATTVTDRIKVSVQILTKKTVPLAVHIVSGGGLTEENVTVDISPNQITIAGEKSAIDTINSLIIQDIDLTTISKSVSISEDIVLDEGIVNISNINAATIKITLKNASEKTMIIPASQISIINAPENFVVSLQETDIQLRIWGGNAAISVVKNENVVLVVDLNGMTDYGEYSVDLQISFKDLATTPRVVGTNKVTVLLSRSPTE